MTSHHHKASYISSIGTSGQPVLCTECLKGTKISVFWAKVTAWSHCTFQGGLVGYAIPTPPPGSMIWGGSTSITFLPPPDQQNPDLGWIDKIVDWWSGTDPCQSPFPSPIPQINMDRVNCRLPLSPSPGSTKCGSGMDWQNCWLSIHCVFRQSPYLLPPLALTKCGSGVDWQNCW